MDSNNPRNLDTRSWNFNAPPSDPSNLSTFFQPSNISEIIETSNSSSDFDSDFSSNVGDLEINSRCGPIQEKEKALVKVEPLSPMNSDDESSPKEPKYVDISNFVHLPQSQAAKKLGIPSSTLSKRWKEATMNRKWPHRALSKLDKELSILLKNLGSGPLTQEKFVRLEQLANERKAESQPVIIRIH